ncbi:MAG: MarR family transcriptional regulator [Chloroflexota bacterium]
MPPGSRLSLLFEFFATGQRVRTLVGEAMAGAALRSDDYAVYSVLFDDGPQTPSDLARRVGMPPTTMSHYVRALLARGHAAREVVATDRRSYRLALTPEGLRAHAAASRAFREADQRFMTALEIDEDAARAMLAAIGTAAAIAESALIADSMEVAG